MQPLLQAIQAHGLLLVADEDLIVRGGAGEIEATLSVQWLGQPLAALLSLPDLATSTDAPAAINDHIIKTSGGERLAARAVRSGAWLLVELEPFPPEERPARQVLREIDDHATALESASDIHTLAIMAADRFRRLTGYDRVEVCHFESDGSSEIIGEVRNAKLPPLIGLHLPASTITAQGRLLCIRNPVRTIGDVAAAPAFLRPPGKEMATVDLDQIGIRATTPGWAKHLGAMGVRGCATISIVVDGRLWGLVLCHHATPRLMDLDTRMACQVLTGVMSRQIRIKEETATYRERLRIRRAIEKIETRFNSDLPGADVGGAIASELRTLFRSNGLAVIENDRVHTFGQCPDQTQLRKLSERVRKEASAGMFVTSMLPSLYPPAQNYAQVASGVLAITLPHPETVIIWMRGERLRHLKWVTLPSEDITPEADDVDRSRDGIAVRRHTVRDHASPWTSDEIQGAVLLRQYFREHGHAIQQRELNQRLEIALEERERLLKQKDFLIHEVNHRVQNSLQLVASFLTLQAKSANSADTADSLAEAQRRISAIGLVHRRLHQDGNDGQIELSHYIRELCEELCGAIGPQWRNELTLILEPTLMSADRAIHIGLVTTELVINVTKYAYDGKAGPIGIALATDADVLTLKVSDRGVLSMKTHEGFGTRMMRAIVQSLKGSLEFVHETPGLCAILKVPGETRR
ncbi:histidine kinase dimerization/phosphoacceptor domain -containing protein [Brytella acorum]|uniref:histidine kinase dimerization/phosphoacceptor domain -containing protein n=1 Tax=Brytella acorum TaxID=2959299 RepID=UPI0025ADE543|nr:histidine kinase dimerization/phosphoacceptor domain -containing protein [Brytella acorum]MDF3623515.1 histidine kinase dimerization/phosphoacceptor domain -containing protein [Brytella acorum]